MEGSDSENDTVWSKGDRCMVQWSGDDQSYKACIVRFVSGDNGEKQALVSFEGFSGEDNEVAPLYKLKRITEKSPRENNDVQCLGNASPYLHIQSMFSPLTGVEEQKRLSEKFSAIDKEETFTSTDRQESGIKSIKGRLKKRREIQENDNNRKKQVVAIGGQVTSKERSRQTSESTQELNCVNMNGRADKATSLRKDRVPTGLTSSESEDEGFSDLDMERPYFPRVTPCSLKEPYILSDPGQTPVVQVPAVMNQYLRDYQREGIQFLYKHYITSRGAILADDMGLGKTVQVIGFLSAVLGKTGTKMDVMKSKPEFIRKMSDHASMYEENQVQRPFLVIGPATVIYNWLEEFNTWGHFTVGKFHRNCKDSTVAELKKNKLDIVVTTYETCRDHVEVINEFSWEAVIADEAHKIKSMKAEVTQALKKLNCDKRYGLTGTPLQNNLAEFWCILDWANANCLGALSTFKNNVCKILDRGQKQDSTKRELAEARCVQEQLAKVKDKWMLRRTKQIIANQLPKKEELVVYCKMADLQSEIYRTIMAQEDMNYILRQREPCSCGSEAKRGSCCFKRTPEGHSLKALTFTYMHLLLKAANHVALLLPKHIESEKQMKYAKRVCEEVFETHPEFLQQNREASFRTLSDPKYCGKMKVLTGLLSVFRKRNSKILLFSYSTRLLNIVEQYVIGKGYEYRRLDGDTPHSKRITVIREFNQDGNVFLFLVSTKAGGVGLNLTGANVVIIFDPNWNPIHDLQAQDRAYRLGQVRDVKVYRLICSGTIEENIYLRQIYKQQRANVAVDAQNAKRYFHRSELFGIENMFLMKDSDRCLTEDILKRNRKVEDGLKMLRIEEYIASSQAEDTEDDQHMPNTEASENLQETKSPVKRGNMSRTGRAKPIVYDSESDRDSVNEDTELPFTTFASEKSEGISCKKSDLKPQLANTTRSYRCRNETTKWTSISDGFQDSQEPSTSTGGLTKQRPSKALVEELDDLWDSFNTVKDDCSENQSKISSNYTGLKMKKSRNRDVGNVVPDEVGDKRCTISNGTSATTCRKAVKRTSSESNNDNTQDTSDEDKGTEAKRLKLKSSDGTGVKGRSSHQHKAGKGELAGRDEGSGESKKQNKQRPGRQGIRFKPQMSYKDEPGVVSEKTDLSGVLNATFESVSDVLDQCGVVHTHHNQRVIGSSKAEDHMSRCAIKDVYELHQHTQAPAMLCDPYSESSEESDDLGSSLTSHKHAEKKARASKRTKTRSGGVNGGSGDVSDSGHKKTSIRNTGSSKWKEVNINKARSETIGSRKVLIGQTPKGIRKQQFTFLSHSLSMNPAALAKQIIYSTPTERIKLLRKFYVRQETDLDPVLESMQSMAEADDKRDLDSDPVDAVKRAKKDKKKEPKRKRTQRTPRGSRSSGRKTSSRSGGVKYADTSDTDISCTRDNSGDENMIMARTNSLMETQHKLIQPTLEEVENHACEASASSDHGLNSSERTTNRVQTDSSSDTEQDTSELPEHCPSSLSAIVTHSSSRMSQETETRRVVKSLRTQRKASQTLGDDSNTDMEQESDVESKGESDRGLQKGELIEKQPEQRPNFDYLDELFF